MVSSVDSLDRVHRSSGVVITDDMKHNPVNASYEQIIDIRSAEGQLTEQAADTGRYHNPSHEDPNSTVKLSESMAF